MRRALSLMGMLALIGLPGCGDEARGGGDPPRLVVSAAASMSEALTDCSSDFADAEVRLQLGGSDELAAQIRQGVKPDVYAAANTGLPEALHDEGLLSAPVEFATNTLVLAVPAGSDVDSVGDLTRDGLKLAIGSESVPIGIYTREVLARLPAARESAILANVGSNEPDVKGIIGKLSQRAVDAGFVYATDVNATGGALSAIELPPELSAEGAYSAGVVEGADQPGHARAFVAGLRRGACSEALERAGFGPPPG